jgi:hypothetical protein
MSEETETITGSDAEDAEDGGAGEQEDGGASEQADGETLARVEQHVREVFANWRKYVVRIRIMRVLLFIRCILNLFILRFSFLCVV